MEKEMKKSYFAAFDRKLLGREYAFQFIDRDLLKLIALVLMTLGHWAFDIYRVVNSKPLLQFFVAAEYFAPPVFFFFISEGFYYTKSNLRYAKRLLIFAFITQIPNALLFPEGLNLNNLLLHWSVLMTLFLGLLALIVIHCNWNLLLRLTAVAALMAVSHLINCDWAVSGIMIILLFDLLREKPLIRLTAYLVLMIFAVSIMVGHLPDIHAFLKFLLPVWAAGIVITFFYNGKKGHFPLLFKYFFYAWYPLHLLLQWIFRLLTN